MIRTQKILMGDLAVYIHREHSFQGLHPDGWHVACSRILVCPACWEAWALLKFVDDTYAWPIPQFCGSCQPPTREHGWYPVPGSLLVEEGWGVIDTALLNALPAELVRREFDLHMGAYSNG